MAAEELMGLPEEGGDLQAFTLAYLAAHEVMCPVCGYNLHALTMARCPECGRELTLKVVSRDRVSRLWILWMVSCSVAAGMGAPMCIFIGHWGWPSSHERHQPFLSMMLVFFLGMIPTPLVVMGMHRRFMRWPEVLRVAVAIGSLCVVLASFGLFLWIMGS